MSDHDFKIAARIKNERSVIPVLQEEITRLRAELEQERAAVQSVSSMNDNLVKERRTLRAELEGVRDVNEELRQTITGLRAEVERRGEMLRRANLYLPSASWVYANFMENQAIDIATRQKATIDESQCRALVSEIEALDP